MNENDTKRLSRLTTILTQLQTKRVLTDQLRGVVIWQIQPGTNARGDLDR